MFNEEELKLIYQCLVNKLNICKRLFEQTKKIYLTEEISELNKLIKKVEEML